MGFVMVLSIKKMLKWAPNTLFKVLNLNSYHENVYTFLPTLDRPWDNLITQIKFSHLLMHAHYSDNP